MSDPVLVAPEAGGEIVRTPEEAATLGQVFGDPTVSQEHYDLAVRERAARELTRREVDTLEDQVLTFAEGVVDAMSLGILRETGDRADVRRDVFSGTQLMGNVAGSLLGLKLPKMPFGAVARAGEKAGRQAVKGLLREGSVLARGVSEASSEAAIAAAWATGHQVMDTVIEDRDFSAEAVLSEVKMAGVLGFGGGMIMGALPRLATGKQVAAQGGMQAPDVSPVRSAWREAVRGYDDALSENAARIGAIKQMRQDGILNSFADDMIPRREEALKAAQRAQKKLAGFRDANVMDMSPGEYKLFQKARDDYFQAVEDLDHLNRPFSHERAPVRVPGRAEDVLGRPQVSSAPVVPDAPIGKDPSYNEYTAPTMYAQTPAYRDGPAPRPTEIGPPPDMTAPAPEPKTVIREAQPEHLAQLLPERTVIDVYAGRRMTDEHLDELTRDAKVIQPHPVAEAADNLLHGDYHDRPLLKLRNGWFAPQMLIEANPSYFARKFPDVIDPAKVRGFDHPPAPPSNLHYVPEPGGGVSPTAQAGDAAPAGLAELNAAVEKLPVREAPVDPNTILEDVPAAQLNAAADRAAAAEARAAQRVADKAEREAAKQAKADEARLEKATTGVWDGVPGDRVVASRALLNDWVAQYEGPRPSPADRAAQRVQALMDELHQMSGGRLDSASAVRMGRDAGIEGSSHPFGSRMDQVWAMRRIGKLAALEARGRKTPLQQGLREDLGALGLGVIASDPLVALAARYFGFGGRVASAAGRVVQMTAKAGQKFLTTNRTRAVLASANNVAWEYSDRGPIQDPLERVEEIRRLAADPAAIAARVEEAAGDLRMVAPEFIQSVTVRTQMQLAALAQEAPEIRYDSMGRPLKPPAGEMRRFHEFENAIHDLGGILRSIEAGSPSPMQLKALQVGYPLAHQRLVGTMLSNPEVLQRLDRAKLRAAEAITGVPLTRRQDPMFIQRQAEAWTPPQPQAPPGRPQAFRINPTGEPTPAQANARAPGN